MKKARSGRSRDELRPEYDFANMAGGVRGKYARRFRAGSNLVLLDPEIAAAFPNDAAVNEALRAVLHAAGMVKRGRGRPDIALERPRATK
jgi:hypothetical protein